MSDSEFRCFRAILDETRGNVSTHNFNNANVTLLPATSALIVNVTENGDGHGSFLVTKLNFYNCSQNSSSQNADQSIDSIMNRIPSTPCQSDNDEKSLPTLSLQVLTADSSKIVSMLRAREQFHQNSRNGTKLNINSEIASLGTITSTPKTDNYVAAANNKNAQSSNEYHQNWCRKCGDSHWCPSIGKSSTTSQSKNVESLHLEPNDTYKPLILEPDTLEVSVNITKATPFQSIYLPTSPESTSTSQSEIENSVTKPNENGRSADGPKREANDDGDVPHKRPKISPPDQSDFSVHVEEEVSKLSSEPPKNVDVSKEENPVDETTRCRCGNVHLGPCPCVPNETTLMPTEVEYNAPNEESTTLENGFRGATVPHGTVQHKTLQPEADESICLCGAVFKARDATHIYNKFGQINNSEPASTHSKKKKGKAQKSHKNALLNGQSKANTIDANRQFIPEDVQPGPLMDKTDMMNRQNKPKIPKTRTKMRKSFHSSTPPKIVKCTPNGRKAKQRKSSSNRGADTKTNEEVLNSKKGNSKKGTNSNGPTTRKNIRT